jgi:hypothetical protein
MPDGKTRTQSQSFHLSRWGYGRVMRPQFLPSYVVSEANERDVWFSQRQGDKGEDSLRQEGGEKISYTTRPLQSARAELDRRTLRFVKSLQRGLVAESSPEYKVNRGVGTETIGNKRIRVTKYGLKSGYGRIGEVFYSTPSETKSGAVKYGRSRKYNLIGGVVLEVYSKGAKKPSSSKEWQIIRPKGTAAKKREGEALLIRKGGRKIGSYSSVERARTALRKTLNDAVNRIRD